MPNPHDLLSLAERCEKAVAGSRELDAAIEKILPCSKEFASQHQRVPMSRWNENAFRFYQIGDEGHEYASPPYSTSLDAAMSLATALPGLLEVTGGWEPDKPEVWPAWTIRWYPRSTPIDGKSWHARIATGATPALALCAANLRALAAMEAEKGGNDGD